MYRSAFGGRIDLLGVLKLTEGPDGALAGREGKLVKVDAGEELL